MDRIDDITLVEIEKIDYHTFSHVNPPLPHPLNSIVLMKACHWLFFFKVGTICKTLHLTCWLRQEFKGPH